MQSIEKIAEAVGAAAASALSVEVYRDVFTTYFTFRRLLYINTVMFFVGFALICLFFNCQSNN